ncbi:polyketide synthase dehydratase domain-containing protein, partial [Streptomyces silvensis]|uniref:polyketide synthase dehydratase domain-containing protein n=1 Tax=Streptomyces silvensis TaxID=1765722 RepID=UPI0018E2DB75
VFAEVALPEGTAAGGFGLHPALLDAASQAAGLTDEAAGGLPFAWSGVRLHASGATVLRVQVAPAAGAPFADAATGALSLAVADGAGAPVATVDALALRPVSQAQPAGDDLGDALFGVDWVPVPLPEGDEPPTTWWTELEALTGSGSSDLADFVVVPCPGTSASDPVAGAHAASHWALDAVRTWLADERYETARLAVVTRGAVAASADEQVRDVAQAAVWGLVRSA